MRGYQKRVIHLKKVQSSVFEEAYFVIKPGCDKLQVTKEKEPDFIREANRIIEESVGLNKKKKDAIGLKETLIFLTGFLISAIISLIIIL